MIIVTIVLVPIGLAFLITAFIINVFRQKKKRRCSYKTHAIITGADRFGRTSQHKARNYGVYEYEYQGMVYHKHSYVGTSFAPELGKTADAYVNPDKPEECIIENWVSALAIGLFAGFGIMFTVLGAVIGIVF